VETLTEHDVTPADPGIAELSALLASPLDPVLTDPARFRIQAALHALPPDAAMSFTILRKALALTDGNLGKHVRVLIDAGFVTTEENWRGKRRTTLYRTTSTGRAAFDAHVQALNAIIRASATPPDLAAELGPPAVEHRDQAVAEPGDDRHDSVGDARGTYHRHDRERSARDQRDSGVREGRCLPPRCTVHV
jgi:DNA-binding MarR family transcriptional regulator